MKRKLKQVFYALIIGLAVVAFWRGAWGVMDVLVFPNNYFLSSIITLVAGLILLFFTKHLAKELI